MSRPDAGGGGRVRRLEHDDGCAAAIAVRNRPSSKVLAVALAVALVVVPAVMRTFPVFLPADADNFTHRAASPRRREPGYNALQNKDSLGGIGRPRPAFANNVQIRCAFVPQINA